MNPLMMAMQGANPMNGKMGQVANVIKMLRSGNPEQIARQMMTQNPQFKAFMEANQGKSPEQVAREHGMDMKKIMGQFK